MAELLTAPHVARTAEPRPRERPLRRVRPSNVNKALLLIRVVVGLLFVGHGSQKLFGWFGGPGMQAWTDSLAKSGLAPAPLWAYAAALAELGSGVLLIIGFLTPFAAAVLIGDMLVAIFDVHAARGLWTMNGGFEYNVVLIALLLSIGLMGPGVYSVDGRVLAWSHQRLFLAALLASLVVAGVALITRM